MLAFAVSIKASSLDMYWKNASEKHTYVNSNFMANFVHRMNLTSTDRRWVLGYGAGSTDWSGGKGYLARFIITQAMDEAAIIVRLNELKVEYGV
jgi:hypothetical protein